MLQLNYINGCKAAIFFWNSEGCYYIYGISSGILVQKIVKFVPYRKKGTKIS